jgi:hypothetical protein
MVAVHVSSPLCDWSSSANLAEPPMLQIEQKQGEQCLQDPMLAAGGEERNLPALWSSC